MFYLANGIKREILGRGDSIQSAFEDARDHDRLSGDGAPRDSSCIKSQETIAAEGDYPWGFNQKFPRYETYYITELSRGFVEWLSVYKNIDETNFFEVDGYDWFMWEDDYESQVLEEKRIREIDELTPEDFLYNEHGGVIGFTKSKDPNGFPCVTHPYIHAKKATGCSDFYNNVAGKYTFRQVINRMKKRKICFI